MSRKYNTVNGIRVYDVDETTRKQIERAGDAAAQAAKAAELGVLDERWAKKMIRALQPVVMLGVMWGYMLSFGVLGYVLSRKVF